MDIRRDRGAECYATVSNFLTVHRGIAISVWLSLPGATDIPQTWSLSQYSAYRLHGQAVPVEVALQRVMTMLLEEAAIQSDVANSLAIDRCQLCASPFTNALVCGMLLVLHIMTILNHQITSTDNVAPTAVLLEVLLSLAYGLPDSEAGLNNSLIVAAVQKIMLLLRHTVKHRAASASMLFDALSKLLTLADPGLGIVEVITDHGESARG